MCICPRKECQQRCPINLAGGAFSIRLLFNINHKYLIVILKKVFTWYFLPNTQNLYKEFPLISLNEFHEKGHTMSNFLYFIDTYLMTFLQFDIIAGSSWQRHDLVGRSWISRNEKSHKHFSCKSGSGWPPTLHHLSSCQGNKKLTVIHVMWYRVFTF